MGWWIAIVGLGCSRTVAPLAVVPDGGPVAETKLVPQLGHRSRITHLALTPDGRYAISADTQPEVVVWDRDAAVVVHRLRLHRDTIRELALSPDGRLLATASDDGSVGMWHVESGRRLHSWTHPEEVESVTFSADGGLVVTGAHDGVARVFDVATGESVEEREIGGWVEVERLDDGRIAAHTSSRIRIWRIGEPAEVRIDPAERFDLAAVRGDGARTVVAGGSSLTVLGPDGSARGELVGHTGPVTDLSFGPQGRLVSTSEDGTARIWDVDARRLVSTYEGHGAAVDEATFGPDGGVVSVGGDYAAHRWDPETGLRGLGLGGIDNPYGYPMIVQRVAVGAGGTILTGHGDGSLSVWDPADGALTSLLRSQTVLATSLDPSPDGRYLAVAHGAQLTVWDLDLGQPAHTLVGHQGTPHQVRWAPDGQTLYSAATDSAVIAWDASTGEATQVFLDAHTEGLHDVAVAPDGASILTGGSDDVAIWWDAATQTPRRRLEGQPGDVHAVAFSPGGRRAVTAGEGGRAFVWDLETGESTATVELPGRRPPTVLSATFSADGRRVLLGSLFRRVLAADTDTGAIVAEIEVGGPVGSLRLSPDGGTLVVGTFDGVTALHDPLTLAPQRTLDPLDSFVLDAQQIGDSGWVASAGMDGTVRFFGPGAPRASVTLINAAQDWAVTDPAGRYDVSLDASEGLAVWVVDGAPYGLSQLRDQFFDPGLLAKALGRVAQPRRDVPALSAVSPPARVRLDGPNADGRVVVTVEERGGGLGEISVTLNDSDVSATFREACGAFTDPCTVDLSGLPTWAKGLDNALRVWMSNASGSVRSRGVVRAVHAAGRPTGDPPDLWVLAVGVSDYAGEGLDLTYPDLDSARVAEALRVAGAEGFGDARTHVRVLSTAELSFVEARPDRGALEAAFAWLRDSDPLDTVVVFFAGHGVAWSDGEVDDYFYLLPSAGSLADLQDPSLRRLRAWSGDDLADALALVPARKRVVVLDTCAAGKLDQALTLERTLSSDAIRAHVRARHRTGAWVLAGSAADQVSYEASRFGQGVLSYALLEAMRGPALDEGDQLWVSRWFAHAEAQVPRYAADIGGIQRPVLRRGAGDFPLGEVPVAARASIRVSAVRPVFVRSVVVAAGGRPDRLGLARAVDAELRRRANEYGAIAVWDVDQAPDAALLTGQYTARGRRIGFEGVVTRGAAEQAVEAEADDLVELTGAIVDQVVAWVGAG